jgi:hypothetical protein
MVVNGHSLLFLQAMAHPSSSQGQPMPPMQPPRILASRLRRQILLPENTSPKFGGLEYLVNLKL